jgi:hypothetical protein
MTTLTEARAALLKLIDSFPAGSTYATKAAVVADYLDNQVPLNIENKALRAQVAANGDAVFGRVKRNVAEDANLIMGNRPAFVIIDDVVPNA